MEIEQCRPRWSSSMTTPNVILLVIDSLRADVTYGSEASTPNIDSFRAHGVTFTQCVSTTTTTTPSFASMLSGTYPPKHGVRGLQGYRLSTAVPTIAEQFVAGGYHTYAEVTGPLLPQTDVLRGFTELTHRQGYKVPFFGWRDDVVAKMKNYLEPWLMLLHIWEVHRPFRSPPDFEKTWDRAGYHAALTATDEWLGPVFEQVGDDALVVITGDHGEEYPDNGWQQLKVRVSRKVRRGLRPAGWFPFLDRKLGARVVGHGFGLQEALVRVPLVIAGAGHPGTTMTDQVRHVDLLPTLGELLGLSVPSHIDGRSLVPLIEGKSLPEEPAYMEAVGEKLGGKRIAGARTPDWKLLRYGSGRCELFRIGGDGPPDEKRNLYARYPEVGRRLESFVDEVSSTESAAEAPMTDEEEAIVEQHLRDLGYL